MFVDICSSVVERSLHVEFSKQVLLIYSYFTTIPGGWAGGRVLDIAKIQLTQPSLVELGLGMSLSIAISCYIDCKKGL